MARLCSARPMKLCAVLTGTRRSSFFSSVVEESGANTASYEICTRALYQGLSCRGMKPACQPI